MEETIVILVTILLNGFSVLGFQCSCVFGFQSTVYGRCHSIIYSKALIPRKII